MKKQTKSKKRKKKQQEDSFIYIILLLMVTVLLIALNYYKLFSIPLSIFVIPFIIYLSSYIFREYGYKETLNSILISISMIVAYLFLIYNLENRVIDIIEVFKNSFIYFITIYLNLIINKHKKNTSKSITSINYILLTALYLVLNIIF